MNSSKPNPATAARLASLYASTRAGGAAARQADAAPAKPVLSAWERWEMGSVGGDPSRTTAAGRMAAARATLPPAPPPPTVPAGVAQTELRRLRNEAEAEGKATGHAEGWAAGHAEGHIAGLATGLAAATAHAEQLRALSTSLPAALRGAESAITDVLLTLALDIARQVVHRTLRAEPEWLLPLVQDLIHAEPTLQGEPRLLLNPADVALVKDSLGNELQQAGWQVRPDDSIQRGGCRVQSPIGEIDATLETRWKSVTAALHRDADAQE
ncbi:flagellar assembly protein FliH [Variovorax sp. LT1P1]|uniref:flagellar assembly protein FliH n=1 Tax=Variovorax sp. LT1P1 TaxID=3443730 RepID=UPI003F44FE1F